MAFLTWILHPVLCYVGKGGCRVHGGMHANFKEIRVDQEKLGVFTVVVREGYKEPRVTFRSRTALQFGLAGFEALLWDRPGRLRTASHHCGASCVNFPIFPFLLGCDFLNQGTKCG